MLLYKNFEFTRSFITVLIYGRRASPSYQSPGARLHTKLSVLQECRAATYAYAKTYVRAGQYGLAALIKLMAVGSMQGTTYAQVPSWYRWVEVV